MGLIRSLFWRLLQTGLVALAVATFCFAALQAMPGDQAVRIAVGRYGEGTLTQATLAGVRRSAGLDRPVAARYAAWIAAAATGRFGRSLVTDRPVLQEVLPRLGVTVQVGLLGTAVAVLLAVPAGAAAGGSAGSRLDQVVISIAALFASMPAFVLGSLLVAGFAIRLHWLPVAGNGTAASLVLPAAALGCGLAPGLARVVRHGVASVLRAPYARFASMRGVPAWRVAISVVARPALLPVLAYAPVLAMQVLEGFIAIELLFNLDGVGLLLVRSLFARDIPVVMVAGIAVTALLATVTVATDMVLHLADPRLRTRAAATP